MAIEIRVSVPHAHVRITNFVALREQKYKKKNTNKQFVEFSLLSSNTSREHLNHFCLFHC